VKRLRYSVEAPGVAVIEICRPEVRNALDCVAQHEFDDLLAQSLADPAVRALVLAGAGGRALSAGWDINEMVSLDPQAHAALVAEREEWLWRWYSCELPTIVAMQGVTYGVGALLAACADLRVGGPGTRFKVTGMSFGYANLAWLLPQLIGAASASEVLLTGKELPGERAAEIGLLNRLVPDVDIRAAAVALAGEVAALPPTGVRDAKRLLRECIGLSARKRYDLENTRIRERLAGAAADEIFAQRRISRRESS
jgi:enoyl-CoA hydratase/carnithine racemase